MSSIAGQVGFSDYSAFCRAFKQEYGIAPAITPGCGANGGHEACRL